MCVDFCRDFFFCISQDKKISRSQRRLEEGGQGAMAMDTASLRKNEEIMAMEVQVKEGMKEEKRTNK